jgi:predicted nucleic acid-binding protein
MAASPVLADSSYYIRLLRERRDPLRALALAAASRDVVICGVVRCEVGRALIAPAVRQRFQAFWDVALNVPTDSRVWAETEQTLWELDRRGVRLPLTDVLIARCALRVGAVVLTFDQHFHDIPGVRAVSRLDI